MFALFLGFLIICRFGSSQTTNFTEFPLTYFVIPQQSVESPGSPNFVPDYYEITLCDSSANYSKAILSILLPSNYKWVNTSPFVYVELSKCAGSFTSSCVFATNYIYNDFGPTLYSELVWYWQQNLSSNSSIYIRVAGSFGRVTYNFELTFTNNNQIPTIYGVYDQAVFGITVTNTITSPVLQTVRSTVSSEVDTNAVVGYFVFFCLSNIINKQFETTINIFADPSQPLSAFNMFLCPGTLSPCTVFNAPHQYPYGSAFISQTVDNSNFDMTKGFYILIQGQGGNANGKNNFFLNCDLNE